MKMPVRRRSAKKKSLFKDLDSPFSVAPDRDALRNLDNVEIPSSPKSEKKKKKKVKKKGYLNRVKPRRRKKNKKMKRRLVTTTRLKSVREIDLEWISETLEKSVEDCVFEGLRCARITLPVDDWTTQRVFRVTHALQKHIDFKEKERQFYTDWYGLDKIKSVLLEALDERRRGDVETASSMMTSMSSLSTNLSSSETTIDAIVSQEREMCKESMRRLRRASFGPNMMAMIQHRRSSVVGASRQSLLETLPSRMSTLPRMSVLPLGRPSALVRCLPSFVRSLLKSQNPDLATQTQVPQTKPTRQTTSRISSVTKTETPDMPICSAAMSTASCLSAIFEFLSTTDLLHVTPLVTSTWWSVAKRVRSWQAAQITAHYTPFSILDCWENLCKAFPRGKFLAEGAFKKVYRVYAKPNDRTEAVAVMNVRRICEDGQADMVGCCGMVLFENIFTHSPNNQIFRYVKSCMRVCRSRNSARTRYVRIMWSGIKSFSLRILHPRNFGIVCKMTRRKTKSRFLHLRSIPKVRGSTFEWNCVMVPMWRRFFEVLRRTICTTRPIPRLVLHFSFKCSSLLMSVSRDIIFVITISSC